MKLFTRIFFFTVLVVTVAMSVLSMCLIGTSFSNAKRTETERAQNEYTMLRATFITGLYSIDKPDEAKLFLLTQKLQRLVPDESFIALKTGEGVVCYSSFPKNAEIGFETNPDISSSVALIDDVYTLCTQSTFEYREDSYTLVTSHSMQSVFDESVRLCRTYVQLYMIMFAAATAVMLVLAFMIARPVNKLSIATKKIADGNYSERISVKADDEIGVLTSNFNKMADEVEQKIYELQDEVKRREDFSAAFAHELKTPLTSVIGYADMICAGGLSNADVKSSAEFIRNEGMRLEALSLKMMELIVSKRHDFTLLEMSIRDCIADLFDTMNAALSKYNANMQTDVPDVYVLIEPDLIKTLFINLIDNSLKAGAHMIRIDGTKCEQGLRISVTDDGSGMDMCETEHITEAFYMIDKSRSRKQHGAGLGLAISLSIAEVHGTQLFFDSEKGKGTTVSFVLKTSEATEE